MNYVCSLKVHVCNSQECGCVVAGLKEKKENCVNIFDFQDPSEDQEVAVMAKWPTVSNFFYNSFMREKKTKNPQKITKIQNPKILLNSC